MVYQSQAEYKDLYISLTTIKKNSRVLKYSKTIYLVSTQVSKITEMAISCLNAFLYVCLCMSACVLAPSMPHHPGALWLIGFRQGLLMGGKSMAALLSEGLDAASVW